MITVCFLLYTEGCRILAIVGGKTKWSEMERGLGGKSRNGFLANRSNATDDREREKGGSDREG